MPSKKIVILLVVVILIIGIFAVYSYSKSSSTQYVSNQPANSLLATVNENTIKNSPDSQKDSDNDGLKDWEEALYGTDPHKADTDGDGTPDGKEIEEGRNPLIKGPKDKIDTVVNKNTTTSTTSEENLTLTDQFARDFFTKYANLQQSGVKVSSDNASQIANDYLNSVTFPNIQATQYTEKDLSLIDANQETLKTYRNQITSIMAQYWPKSNNTEYTILQNSVNDGDSGELQKLTPIISQYKLMIQGLVNMPVPKLAMSLHLNILNNLSSYISTLTMIQKSGSDPLSGLVGIQNFQTYQSNLLASFANLRIYFINNIQ